MRNNILGLGFSGAVAGAEGGFDPGLVAPGGGSGAPAEGPSGAPGEGIGGLLPPKGGSPVGATDARPGIDLLIDVDSAQVGHGDVEPGPAEFLGGALHERGRVQAAGGRRPGRGRRSRSRCRSPPPPPSPRRGRTG